MEPARHPALGEHERIEAVCFPPPTGRFVRIIRSGLKWWRAVSDSGEVKPNRIGASHDYPDHDQ